jgi:hypothetical protein
MKVTVYNIKGSAGKTPIATSIALDNACCIGTNESIDVYGHLFSEDTQVTIGQNEAFPDYTDETSIVFDLSGSISNTAISITSAIKQSDVVIVPIYNHTRCLQGGLQTILEVQQFTKNIIVVATKLTKSKFTGKRKEGDLGFGAYDWTKSEDFINIKNQIEKNVDFKITILPLKLTNGFDYADDKSLSITELANESNLMMHRYRTEIKQLETLYSEIKKYGK